MSRIYAKIALLNSFLFAGLASAQIALVHVSSCGPILSAGQGCIIPATGQGNLIVVGWQLGGFANTGDGILSITDNAGNSYSQAVGARSINLLNGSVADIWYARNSIPGAQTVTINSLNSGLYGAAVIWEFAGIDPTAPLDQTAALDSQLPTFRPLGATVSTSVNAEAIVSVAADSGYIVGIAQGNNFLADSWLKASGWAHLITSTSGVYGAAWFATVGSYASSTASFKAASTGNPSVALNWDASLSADVTGYNVYRGTISGGPYALINTALVPSTTYTDNTVQAGLTYYYVTTAVASDGAQSVYSNQATATIPQ